MRGAKHARMGSGRRDKDRHLGGGYQGPDVGTKLKNVKQNKKGKKCAVFCFAGKRKIFFIYL
jgi:hypothetical protein